MKTIHLTVVLVTLSCFALVGTSVAAQSKPTKNTPSTPSTTGSTPLRFSYFKELGLTKAEQQEIKQIKGAAREELDQKILAVLTPEQKGQLQQLSLSATTGTTPRKHK